MSHDGQPIYLVLGAPMRGIAGGERKQHLSIWAIEADRADQVRRTISQSGESTELERLREEFEGLLVEVLEHTKISWCPVVEARPEVTIRRDEESLLSSFRGQSIAIWGCGALGAPIAMHLCRAGVRRLVLRDKGIVTPGILVRQPFLAEQVGGLKVEALKNQLLEIRPDLKIETHSSNIETLLLTPGQAWNDGSEIVLDATASDLVRRRLEVVWPSTKEGRVPIASLMLDRTANRLITTVIGTEFSGGTWDALRKAKIEMLHDPSFDAFSDSFFPAEFKQKPFQPEPGCSEPTFVGSSADCAGLAAIGLNMIAKQLAQLSPGAATSNLFAQPVAADGNVQVITPFAFPTDFVLKLDGHEVRISPCALKEIKGWINRNGRIRDRRVETGGLLWGEWDDASGIVWVTDASGPPPDSRHSEQEFICGVAGTKKEHEKRLKLTRQSVGYIGMWHTHPTSRPRPSGTDIRGMHNILTAGELPPRKNLLLIFGRHLGHDTVGAALFRRMKGDEIYAVHSLVQGQKRLPGNIL